MSPVLWGHHLLQSQIGPTAPNTEEALVDSLDIGLLSFFFARLEEYCGMLSYILCTVEC
jgi:hypothetical protein